MCCRGASIRIKLGRREHQVIDEFAWEENGSHWHPENYDEIYGRMTMKATLIK